jgi:hypothetical protein
LGPTIFTLDFRVAVRFLGFPFRPSAYFFDFFAAALVETLLWSDASCTPPSKDESALEPLVRFAPTRAPAFVPIVNDSFDDSFVNDANE